MKTATKGGLGRREKKNWLVGEEKIKKLEAEVLFIFFLIFSFVVFISFEEATGRKIMDQKDLRKNVCKVHINFLAFPRQSQKKKQNRKRRFSQTQRKRRQRDRKKISE